MGILQLKTVIFEGSFVLYAGGIHGLGIHGFGIFCGDAMKKGAKGGAVTGYILSSDELVSDRVTDQERHALSCYMIHVPHLQTIEIRNRLGLSANMETSIYFVPTGMYRFLNCNPKKNSRERTAANVRWVPVVDVTKLNLPREPFKPDQPRLIKAFQLEAIRDIAVNEELLLDADYFDADVDEVLQPWTDWPGLTGRKPQPNPVSLSDSDAEGEYEPGWSQELNSKKNKFKTRKTVKRKTKAIQEEEKQEIEQKEEQEEEEQEEEEQEEKEQEEEEEKEQLQAAAAGIKRSAPSESVRSRSRARDGSSKKLRKN